MTKVAVVIAVLLLVSMAVQADNLLIELDDAIVRGVETSTLIGNIGPAIGLFWPMATIPQLDVTVGPLAAIGHEAVVGGGGAQLPVSITVAGFELPIDFGFAGAAYNWKAKDIEFCGGVGKTFSVEF